MKNFKKYWLISMGGVILVSFYPLYMGISVIYDMLTTGMVAQEDYPKYVIPYTPVSLAIIIGVFLMPVLFQFMKKAVLPAASVVSLGVFFMAELLLEDKVIVTSDVTTTLESWQMYMCIAYLPSASPEIKTQRAIDVLIGDYSPTFKLHFYFISIILIISFLNCFYGFGQIVRDGQRTRLKALIVQSVCFVMFLALCILACFTAFFRNGEIRVPVVSAILMSLFFVVFGVTAGVYVGSFLLGKKKSVSIVLPAIIASIVTLMMYIGEMCLLSGNLYRFGSGVMFDGIPVIVLAPMDIIVIMVSGGLTAIIGNDLNEVK